MRDSVSSCAGGASVFRVTGPSLLAASAFGSVHNLLHSTAFNLARNFMLFLAVVFWLGLAYWVYRDARRRVDDPWLVGTATLLALVVPYVGPVIYLLFRPAEILDEVRERELGVQALEASLGHHAQHCPVCRADTDAAFLVCPVCTTRLKQRCRSCSAALDASWQACPYCATLVGSEPELVTPDLDAALTAEVAASSNGNGKPQRRPKRTRAAT